MRNTVLLTGATGFLGRHVLHELLQRGYTVRILVRKQSTYSLPENDHIECIPVDNLFTVPLDALCTLLDGVSTLIHAAWYTYPHDYLESVHNLQCLRGTLTLAEACVQHGGIRFAGIGSFFEYDMAQGYLRTCTPLLGDTLYATCKIAAYQTITQYYTSHPCSFTWLRPFSMYGEAADSGENPGRLVPLIHEKCARGEKILLTSGTQVRDYTEIHDAARMVADAALSEVQGAVNICTGKGITVRALAERIADRYKRRDLLHFGAKAHNPKEPPFIVGEARPSL